MSIKDDIELMLAKRSMSLSDLAKKLSIKDKPISEKCLLKKLSDKTIEFMEVEKITEILGFNMVLRKKDNIESE